MENPDEIRRSWALQTNWQSGPKVMNKLQPPIFGRVVTPFVQTWREQAQPALDWGAQNFIIADGRVIIQDGHHRYGLATAAPISALPEGTGADAAGWQVRVDAALPVAVRATASLGPTGVVLLADGMGLEPAMAHSGPVPTEVGAMYQLRFEATHLIIRGYPLNCR